MIKKTLYFANPTYIKLKHKQLHIHIKTKVNEKEVTRSVEDVGIVMLDNDQITITHGAMRALQENKAVIISCAANRMPHSIMLPIEGHTEQSERYKIQLAASLPLKKKLWQQTVEAKVRNQMLVLEKLEKPTHRLRILLRRVQSGDPENIEGQAAAYYWPTLIEGFIRDRYGEPPNNLLNYGYAVLRAMTARALVSSGMLPTIGIHHKNKYNAFCLADDIMEPFRPFMDMIVYNMFINNELESFLSTSSKQHLLSITQLDAKFGKKKSPLMVGMSTTTASLYKCYSGEKRKIIYPLIE